MTTLRIAVVGHTNTGKTSLMRTLMRDRSFGEVADQAGVTRKIEGAALQVDGRALVHLYDTPGLEDSVSLLEWIDEHAADRRESGAAQVRRFLDGPQAQGVYVQEARALRQVLETDVALYVIDARDPVLEKFSDELEILRRTSTPIVPVLNFVASREADVTSWRQMLTERGLHAVASFDTVVFDPEDERRLFEKITVLAETHRLTLESLIAARQRDRDRLRRSSVRHVASLLIDVAAYAERVERESDEALLKETSDLFQKAVRDHEAACVGSLLRLHRFGEEDYTGAAVPIEDGQWPVDLFSSEALKELGITSTGGAAAGAAAGLMLDVMLGGLSLGAATALGAGVGALLGAGRSHARKLVDHVRGYGLLRCDDNTLKVLMARQIWLVRALLSRGHASQAPLSTDAMKQEVSEDLPGLFGNARQSPEWSLLTNPGAAGIGRRDRAIEELSEVIERRLTDGANR